MSVFAHTFFSLRYGILSVAETYHLCCELGYQKVVLADINNTSATMDMIRLSKKDNKLSIVPGVDFRNGNKKEFIAIAKNNEGFKEINDFLTAYLHKKSKIEIKAPLFTNAYIIYPYEKKGLFTLKENEFWSIDHTHLNQLSWKKDRTDLSQTIICHHATFRTKQDHNIHRLLRAIDNNTLLSKLSKTEEGNTSDLFLSHQKLTEEYSDFPELLASTNTLIDKCSFDMTFKVSKNLKTFSESEQKDIDTLKRLCQEGLPYRYSVITKEITERIEKEINTIVAKGFVSYFLINWDMLCYARKKEYYYVGRGSGANSVVAYLLKITDVDPIELDLYFERFINLYRENPPDFDIDFSWKDRDDILNYLFRKYDNISLLATYNTFQYKGVIRELGKVFGLPKHEIDTLATDKGRRPAKDDITRLVLKYGALIEGKPNHLSIHPGGVLISEKSLQYYSATSLPPKGLPTIQFDMVIAEDLGLYKFDILSQRGLAKVKNAIELIKENRADADLLDIRQVQLLKKDPKTLETLKKGEAIGCFYVESPAMRMLFKKLEVRNYLGLVAASSVIRPGVAQSGMMTEYIYRYRNPKKRAEAHPILLKIMPETYGVMVYQEDVIKVAHEFAGLTLAQSDVLRRGMSGKYRGREEFVKAQNAYFTNCKARGYEDSEAKEIWRQIESFAGYAFSKGHSASYAVESFQALYLKAHFPLEYMVATINNGGGFYKVETYLHELRKHGATVHPPCINNSKHLAIIKGKDVYLGFGFITGIQEETSFNICYSRIDLGDFLDFDDFLERTYIQFEQLLNLININAFRFTGKNNKQLLLESYLKVNKKVNKPSELKLFQSKQTFKLPQLNTSKMEQAFDQIEFLGYPLTSPFELLATQHKLHTIVTDFKSKLNKTIRIYGYLIAIKRTRTVKGDTMNFGTFIDIEGNFIDTVHFPTVATQFPFIGKGIYLLEGYVREEFDYYTLEVYKMTKEAYIEDPRFTQTS